jgi:hypothetical protein
MTALGGLLVMVADQTQPACLKPDYRTSSESCRTSTNTA